MRNRVGEKFGRLTVIEATAERYERNVVWLCQCECGGFKKISGHHISGGKVTSCGCAAEEYRKDSKTRAEQATTHGLSKTPEYRIWASMWFRCTNKESPDYVYYKDRTPPEEWKDFGVFLKDMGPRPEGFTLERKENDKPYGPGNCKWATQVEQANNRRNNIRVEYEGRVQTIAQWAREKNFVYHTLARRYRAGLRGDELFKPL